MSQHQAVFFRNPRSLSPKSDCNARARSQSKNQPSSARREMSARDWVAEEPQLLHRHRVLPALVLPFLTSLVPHTPQTG